MLTIYRYDRDPDYTAFSPRPYYSEDQVLDNKAAPPVLRQKLTREELYYPPRINSLKSCVDQAAVIRPLEYRGATFQAHWKCQDKHLWRLLQIRLDAMNRA